MSSRLFLLCTITGLMIALTASLSILMVESIPSISHHMCATVLVKGLLQKGHHVHMVSINRPKIDGDLAQNLTYAIFDGVMKEMQETYTFIKWQNNMAIYTMYLTYNWANSGCEKVMRTNGAMGLLEIVKRKKFDVIVHDITLYQCLYGLWEIAKGKPPVVGFSPLGAAPWLNTYDGYYPTVRTYMYGHISGLTSVWQRTYNILHYIIDDVFYQYYHLPSAQRLAEKYIGHEIRSLREIQKTVSIVLLNTHPSFDGAIPLPPNVLEIGGMHAQTQSALVDVNTKYPKSIRKFLDEAENGVIVISLGTVVMWKDMGMEKIKLVALVVSQLKQRILWRIDVDIPIPIPPNVMTVRWFPQKEILDHKNIRAIWTHGGLFSMQEAIWKGIPMIGTPFCFDQNYNMNLLAAKGAGIYLHFQALSIQYLLNAFEQIIYNKSYAENMKRLSNEFRDRSVPPLDLAIWGIEYAARNPNSSLVSPLKFQSWIEQNMIDVYMIVILSVCVLLSSVIFITKMVCKWLRKSAVDKNKQM